MEFLKNVKISHDERRDIDYVQDVEIVDRLPKIEEEFEGCVVGSIDLTRVDIQFHYTTLSLPNPSIYLAKFQHQLSQSV